MTQQSETIGFWRWVIRPRQLIGILMLTILTLPVPYSIKWGVVQTPLEGVIVGGFWMLLVTLTVEHLPEDPVEVTPE